MIDDGTCYRCPLMKYHEGPCEITEPPMNSDHAPTAEVTKFWCEGCFKYVEDAVMCPTCGTPIIVKYFAGAPALEELPHMRPQAFRYADDFDVWKKREELLTAQRDSALQNAANLESELAIARDLIREKDKQYALCCEARLDALNGFHEKLAENDATIATMRARIEELEKDNGLLEEAKTYYWSLIYGPEPTSVVGRAASAEAKLRAVSDALEEKLEAESVFDPDCEDYIHRYDKHAVDARDARIRALLEGK